MFVTSKYFQDYSKINYQVINYNMIKQENVGITFSAKSDYADLLLKLNNKMNTRSGNVKKLYKYGIDFIKSKINIEKYLEDMYNLLRNTKGEQWENIDQNESIYIGNYGVFFDINGPSTDRTNKSAIIDFLYDLVD